MHRALLWIALALAFVVIGASSGLRLAADGVGCEPWPRCYGRTAEAAVPAELREQRAVSPAERAVRLGHRAAAGAFALVALAAVALGWRRANRRARLAGALLLAVTAALAVVGRYTPSGLPIATLANVTGGLLLAGAIAFLLAGSTNGTARGGATAWLGALALMFALQAASGASISVRQEGAACADGCSAGWPTTAPRLWHPLQPGTAVEVTRDARAGEVLHGVHRLLAILLVVVAAGAVACAARGAGAVRGLLAALALCGATAWIITAAGATLAAVVGHALAAGALAAAVGAFAGAGRIERGAA